MEQPRDTGVQPRQGEVRPPTGAASWWKTHTNCFSQVGGPRYVEQAESTEPRPKRPRVVRPEVMKSVQQLIAELVSDGWRLVYTDGSSPQAPPSPAVNPVSAVLRPGGNAIFTLVVYLVAESRQWVYGPRTCISIDPWGSTEGGCAGWWHFCSTSGNERQTPFPGYSYGLCLETGATLGSFLRSDRIHGFPWQVSVWICLFCFAPRLPM